MDTLSAMAARFTCRNYKDEQITENELRILLEAAGTAPNAAPHDGSPFCTTWISVVQKPEMLERINRLQPGNDVTHGAPTVLVLCGVAEKECGLDLAISNVSCIAENIFLAATEIGLGSACIFGVTRDIRSDAELCRELGIPEGFEPCTAVAVGYAAVQMERKMLRADRIRTSRV